MNALNTMLKQFVRDRDKALLSLDKEKILAYMKKYNIPHAESEPVFWASVYKCIFHIKSSTKEQKEEAKQWLEANGFTTDV